MNRRKFLQTSILGLIAAPTLTRAFSEAKTDTENVTKNRVLSWENDDRFLVQDIGVPSYVVAYVELPSYCTETKSWTPIEVKMYRLIDSSDDNMISHLKLARKIKIYTFTSIGRVENIYEIDLSKLTNIRYDQLENTNFTMMAAKFDVKSAKTVT